MVKSMMKRMKDVMIIFERMLARACVTAKNAIAVRMTSERGNSVPPTLVSYIEVVALANGTMTSRKIEVAMKAGFTKSPFP